MPLVLIIYIALIILLILISAVKIVPYRVSLFELSRRIKLGDDNARKIRKFNNSVGYYISMQKISEAILLVGIALTGFIYFENKILAVLLGLVIACFYNVISRLNFVHKISKITIRPFYASFINFLDSSKKYFGFLTFIKPTEIVLDARINSRFELQHIIDTSNGLLTPDEKNLIVNGLSFHGSLIRDIMTKRSDIIYVKKSEFLGPLTLSDLYKKGHTRLPVIGKNLDDIVGILYIKKLLSLDNKSSSTAEKSMDPSVYYINQDQTLSEALALLLSTHNHMSIVINDKLETVGIITLGDILLNLFGKKLTEEFNDYDNLNVVAKRLQ